MLGTRRRIADAIGLVIRPTFVAFTPWTSLDDYLHVMDVVEELGWIDNVAPVQYTIRLLVPLDSCLLGKPYTDPHLTVFDEDLFSYRWQHPDPRMDDLCHRVNALVRDAEAQGEDPRLTFYRIRSLALSVASERMTSAVAAVPLPERRAIPRLSEPWFC